MKKTFLFVIFIFLSFHLLNAQPPCLKDVIYTLVYQEGQIPKARKMMEENCFPGNESSPDAWLVRANVFIQLYEYEIDRKNKDPKYIIRWPDAIITSNESFYKAVELKQDISIDRLIDPKEGQLLSAPPIHDLAAKAMDNKDFPEAIRLLNMVIRSYKADLKGHARYLPYVYIDLANCYKAMGDDANYKKILMDATKLNEPESIIYLKLYDVYKQENDTVKCGEILNQARKIIPDSLAIHVKTYELDYFAMTGDTAKLKTAAIKMYEQYKGDIDVINLVVAHLIYNKEYLLAQEMIEAGLEIAPDDFDLNQQMTYRYFYEAIDYDKIKEEKLNEKPRKFIEAEAALNKANEILGVAVIWAEKAYNIEKNDVQHNKMYSQILVRLLMPVPEDLQEKIDSYNKQ
jgi:tetratricopeptide (TPR) repeat protein